MSVTRELKITYGAYVVGDGGDMEHIVGKPTIEKSFEDGYLEFVFLVRASTEAAFAAACVAAETAFRKPYQMLTVELGDETILSISQSTSTGLDPMPSITKYGDDGDTGRSRLYRVRITFGLPASTGAEQVSGLRDLNINVSYDPARRATVTFTGTFTAVGATGARAKYSAGIGTIITAAKSDLGISNWERAEEPTVQADTNDKLCEFAIIFEEIIFSQGGASVDDTDIVRQRLDISRMTEGPGDTPIAERLATLVLSYSAWIDKDQTTDLRSKYSSIRSWLVTQIENTLNGGLYAVVTEEPDFFYDENRISVRMVAVGQPQGEIVIENRVTTGDDDVKGWEIVPAWTGDPLSAYRYPGPRIVVRTVTQVQKKVGTFDESDAIALGRPEAASARDRTPVDAGGGVWTVIAENPQATPLRMGVSPDQMDVTELTLVTRMRYSKEPTASSGSGGRGGAVTDPRS